jgi:hypothetical protein
MANHKSEIVAFRADPGLLRLIDEAAKPYGISRGAWVKNVITEKVMELHDPTVDEPQGDMTATLKVTKHELTVIIGRALYYILTNPDGLPAEDANRLVREKILPVTE